MAKRETQRERLLRFEAENETLRKQIYLLRGEVFALEALGEELKELQDLRAAREAHDEEMDALRVSVKEAEDATKEAIEAVKDDVDAAREMQEIAEIEAREAEEARDDLDAELDESTNYRVEFLTALRVLGMTERAWGWSKQRSDYINFVDAEEASG